MEEQNETNAEFGSLDMSDFLMFDETPAEVTPPANPDEVKPIVNENITLSESEKAESVASGGQVEAEENSDQGSPNLYSSFASALKEDGIFSSLDLEKTKIENAQDLIDAVKAQLKENEFASLNDDQKEFLTAQAAGVPLEAYKEAKSVESQLMSITVDQIGENAELAEAMLVQDFMDNGATEAKAKQFTQMLVDKGVAVDEAKKALPEIQGRATQRIADQTKAGQEVQRKGQEKIDQFKTDVSKTLTESTEIISGMAVNEQVKKDVLDSILKPVHTLDDGTQINKITKDRLADPVAFDIRMHYVYHITKGLTDFGVLNAKAKTNAINELDSLIKSNTFVKGGNNTNLNEMISHGDAFDFGGSGLEIDL